MACALAINAAGHVAGQIDWDGDYHHTAGFWWGEGVKVGIGTGDASGINDADTVVGTTDDMPYPLLTASAPSFISEGQERPPRSL